MDPEDQLPHVGDRPSWGYMNKYEWNGEEYEDRPDLSGVEPQSWGDELQPAEWREILLELYQKPAPREVFHEEIEEDEGLEEAIASFSDGINIGFYINSYTTKHCPTMDGVLEELRKGIARLEEQREADAMRLKEMEDKVSKGLICEAPVQKKKSAFAETLNTLSRLQSSYRRCYWKSGSEMLFPMLFGHLTYASHRCWTVYIKKAI